MSEFDELLTCEGSNLEYNIVKAFRLLLTYCGSNLPTAIRDKLKLLNLCVSIFKSDHISKVFLYFCEHKVATSWILRVRIPLEQNQVWKACNSLQALGIIHDITPVRRVEKVRGGPRYRVYGVWDATEADVVECIKLHNRCRSPKYLVAEELAQSVLDEYLLPRGITEITYANYAQWVRSNNKFRGPYNIADVIEISIPLVQENGVKVWK